MIAHLCAVDIELIAERCCTLLATSNNHKIKLFTDSFVKKLFKCSNSNLLKMYLLPFNTWLDNTILIELSTTYENINIFEQFCNFIRIIDDNRPITSYPIPTFSQLVISLDDSEYTLVATETVRNCNELVLKDITDVKEFLKSYWELTNHAIQLAAIDYNYNNIYWMIPKQIQLLIENKLNQGQHKFWHKEIFQVVLLPKDFFSTDNYRDRFMINNPFKVSNLVSKDSLKVCVVGEYVD